MILIRRLARIALVAYFPFFPLGCVGTAHDYLRGELYKIVKERPRDATPEDYLEIIDYVENDASLRRIPRYEARYTEAKKEITALFAQANIKRVEVSFLSHERFAWPVSEPAYRERQEKELRYHEAFYEQFLKKPILTRLAEKGYSVGSGETIYTSFVEKGKKLNSTTSQSSVSLKTAVDHNLTYPVDGRTEYLSAEPFLKTKTAENADAVVLVELIDFGFWSVNRRDWGSPLRMDEISYFAIRYHVFDLRAGRRMFVGGRKASRDREEVSRELVSSWPVAPGASSAVRDTYRIRWRFTESGDAFLNRIVGSIFSELPMAR